MLTLDAYRFSAQVRSKEGSRVQKKVWDETIEVLLNDTGSDLSNRL